MAGKNTTPIIKKIRKSAKHAPHGGSWKVAYADFVTALMAFFLLLWLLQTSSKDTLKGISEYFLPDFGSESERKQYLDGEQAFQNEEISKITEIFGSNSKLFVEENESSLQNLKVTIEDIISSSTFAQNVYVELVKEGLKIEILDRDNNFLFSEGKAEVLQPANQLLNLIAEALRYIPKYISITGHATKNEVNSRTDYSTWELSFERANNIRKYFLRRGLVAEYFLELIGQSSNNPIDTKNLYAPANRRVTIVLVKNSSIPDYKKLVPNKVID